MGFGGADREKRERSLVSYLVMPRVAAAYGYGSLSVMAYVLVRVTGDPPDGVALWAAVAAWVVFELGLYQGRYLVNDVLDAEVDRAHTAARSRGRLPAVPHARDWAVVAGVARLAAAALVVVLLPAEARTITLVAAAALVIAAVAYEACRSVIRRRAAQLRADADGDTDAGAGPAPGRLTRAELAVYSIVGAGKGLRVCFGMALAGASGGALVAGVAFGWAYGTMTDIQSWTLEAAGLRAGGADDVLARKSHVGWLAQLVGDDPDRLHRPLLTGPPALLAAVLFAVASTLTVVVSAALGGWPEAAQLVALLAVSVVVGPLLNATWPSLWAGRVVMVLDVAAVGFLATRDSAPGMAVMLLFVSAVAATLRSFTPADLKLAPPRTVAR
jgi:hypothetical protein